MLTGTFLGTKTCYHYFDTHQGAHKDGYPHFHILLWTKELIPFDWIQEKWVKYGVGRFVNISNKTRKFENIKHVVDYVTKYLMKSVGDAVSWFKRWSQSRGFL